MYKWSLNLNKSKLECPVEKKQPEHYEICISLFAGGFFVKESFLFTSRLVAWLHTGMHMNWFASEARVNATSQNTESCITTQTEKQRLHSLVIWNMERDQKKNLLIFIADISNPGYFRVIWAFQGKAFGMVKLSPICHVTLPVLVKVSCWTRLLHFPF